MVKKLLASSLLVLGLAGLFTGCHYSTKENRLAKECYYERIELEKKQELFGATQQFLSEQQREDLLERQRSHENMGGANSLLYFSSVLPTMVGLMKLIKYYSD